jgi:hypothetical protein
MKPCAMVEAYLDDMLRAEATIELFRVSLRGGFMTIEQARLSEQKAAQEPVDDPLRTSLFPESARRRRADEELRAAGSDANGDLVFEHSAAAVSNYKTARLEAMASRGYRYAEVTVDAVARACDACRL